MRLSTAIILGRYVIEEIDAMNFCGCAIGMGLAALGHKYPTKSTMAAREDAIIEWPWLEKVAPIVPNWFSGRMHNMYSHEYGIPTEAAINIISEGFAHVHFYHTLSLEALADYIASIEPPEPSDFEELPDEVSKANPMHVEA